MKSEKIKNQNIKNIAICADVERNQQTASSSGYIKVKLKLIANYFIYNCFYNPLKPSEINLHKK